MSPTDFSSIADAIRFIHEHSTWSKTGSGAGTKLVATCNCPGEEKSTETAVRYIIEKYQEQGVLSETAFNLSVNGPTLEIGGIKLLALLSIAGLNFTTAGKVVNGKPEEHDTYLFFSDEPKINAAQKKLFDVLVNAVIFDPKAEGKVRLPLDAATKTLTNAYAVTDGGTIMQDPQAVNFEAAAHARRDRDIMEHALNSVAGRKL